LIKIANNHSPVKQNRLSGLCCGILIFLFFFTRFLISFLGRNTFSTWITTPYVINYQSGFIARAFVGSVIALFTDDLTLKQFKIIAFTATLALIALISYLIGKVIAGISKELKNTVIIFVFLFVSAPVSLTYMFEAHFGRFDVYMLLLTLIGLVCLRNPVLKWFVPVICFAAVATHPGYLVTFMPGLAIPMLYEVYRSRCSKKSVAIFSSSCLILLGLFFYFQLFSRKQLDFSTAEEMGRFLSQHTDMKIGLPMLYLEYFAPFPDWITKWVIPESLSMNLPEVGIALLTVSLPLIVIFAVVWKNSIRNAKDKFLKFIFLLCSFTPLMFFVSAFFGHDWDRQWAPLIHCQFIYLFYFIVSHEHAVTDSLKHLADFFEKHSLVLLFILLFAGLAMLSNLGTLFLNFWDKILYYDFFGTALRDFEYMLE